MAFLFYTLCFAFLIVATALYATRSIWRPYAPPIPYLTAPGTIPEPLYRFYTGTQDYIDSWRYSRLPTNFQEDAEAGLHSTNFNLAENIEGEDSRSGLDADAKRQIYAIMRRRGVQFDEARRIWIEERFRRQGIGADGRPLDRKAVVFS